MAKYSVSARGLAVGYDGRSVLRDISFEIQPGEIVTMIGPNGAGKSTLLKSLARQLKIQAGTAEIDGRALSEWPMRALSTRMAVVLTDRVRPELMTCRDVVATGRYPYTGRLGILSKEDEAQIDAAMRAVRALELAGRDFNAISDGQRQRVLLARAICQEPEIILLDEPTSFLDIRHKLELLEILKHMAREKGITVIMSLHEIDLAQKVSDKILCVEGESAVRFGTPDQVFTEAGMQALYHLEQPSYDPLFGAIELPRAEGAPQALVLSACGTGIPVYRRLHRAGVPFAAGVLYRGDVDWHLARRLAVEVVEEAPFAEISNAAFDRASALIEAVPRVIDAGVEIGLINWRMGALIDAAKAADKYERAER